MNAKSQKIVLRLFFILSLIVSNSIIASAADMWTGTFNITGSMYRNAFTEAYLTLKASGAGNYTGTITISADGGDKGSITGKISARAKGMKLIVRLDSFSTKKRSGNIFYSECYDRLKQGNNIFEIRGTDRNNYFQVIPVGAMSDYFDGMTERTEIEKIK